MTDIIQDAKQLLYDSTPGPWEWIGYDLEQVTSAGSATVLEFQCVTEFGMTGALRDVEVTPEDEELIAAAPELAQALAEETWEYSVQIKDHTGEWETATNSESHLEEWWESKNTLNGLWQKSRNSVNIAASFAAAYHQWR